AVANIHDEATVFVILDLNTDCVRSRLQGLRLIFSCSIGGKRGLRIRDFRTDSNRNSRERLADRIRHGALYRAGGRFFLGHGHPRQEQHCSDGKNKMNETARDPSPTTRRAQIHQTLSPLHSWTYGYGHMESHPTGMVASALQSRIDYLTKRGG